MNHQKIYDELVDILLKPERQKIIAAKSYLHTNHFFKLILKQDEKTGDILRLHYFLLPHASDVDQNPHDHGWAFTSTVLYGSLNEIQYAEEEPITRTRTLNKNLIKYFKCSLDLTTTDPVYRLTPTGVTLLKPIRTRTYRTGITYELDEKTIHTTHPTKTGTMTIVVQHKSPINTTNHVYVPTLELRKHKMESQQRCLTQVEVIVMISIALQKLKRIMKKPITHHSHSHSHSHILSKL
jgi:hypothetical protein